MPTSLLLTVIALLGKDQGERPIGLLLLASALLTSARKPIIQQWDRDKHAWWDDAIAGSSSLRAFLRRSLGDEVNWLNGGHNLGIFYDFEKFYDSINPTKLIWEALNLGYSPLLLYIGMQVHLAPRILKCGDALSDETLVFSSILAGCAQSNSWARAFVHHSVEAAHWQIPGELIEIREYVDDLAQSGRAKKHGLDELVAFSMKVARQLVGAAERAGCTISRRKTKATATSAKLARSATTA